MSSNLAQYLTLILAFEAEREEIAHLHGEERFDAFRDAAVTSILPQIRRRLAKGDTVAEQFIDALIVAAAEIHYPNPKPAPAPPPIVVPPVPPTRPLYDIPVLGEPLLPHDDALKSSIWGFFAGDLKFVSEPSGAWVVRRAGSSPPLISPPIGGEWVAAGVIS